MRLRRLSAIAVKEMLQIWRDPRSLAIALLMPFMQMLLLGYGVSLDIKHVPLCIYDRENSPSSRDLLQRFEASDYFQLVAAVGDYGAVGRAIDRGECRLAIVIPPDFSERLADTGTSAVQALVDGTDTNTANVAIGYAQAVVGAYSSDLEIQAAGVGGRPFQIIEPVAVQSRVLFNEDLESRDFIIPGAVALIMALVGAQLTSLTVAREWERGTMELLISTPVSPREMMLGKLLPYFAIGLLDAAFCLAFAVFWFHVPFRGTLLTLFVTTSLFLVVVLGIGYLISTAIKSQVGAAQIGLVVTMLPTALLSGFTFPIDQMPHWVRVITYLVFGRYYVTILKAVFLKGSSVADLATPMLAMALYAAIVAFLAGRAFKKRLE
ncbi:MAG TPA: ABC transporter permease [Alphaproteobacteria bacterium]|nr:ABC transporter permease [Alphaproteobacteria bacterium]